MSAPAIFTAGHSSHGVEAFAALLAAHRIDVVADVRSTPYSRRYPHFARDRFEAWLAERGVGYRFCGDALGARSRDPAHYDDEGRVRYERLAGTPAFRAAVAALAERARAERLALVCAEREPLACHRTLLVAPALVAAGLEVVHIHPDGRLEPHPAALERLAAGSRLPAADLFQTERERTEAACARQARRIAFRDPAMARAGAGPAARGPGRPDRVD